MSFDIDETKRRIEEIKRRMIEFIDYTNSWEEIEAKKRSAELTPIQEGEEEDEEDSEEGSIE